MHYGVQQQRNCMHIIRCRAMEQPSHTPFPVAFDIRPHPVLTRFQKFESSTSLMQINNKKLRYRKEHSV